MKTTIADVMIPTQDCACGKKAIYSNLAGVWYCSCRKDLPIMQNTRETLHLVWKSVNGLSKKARKPFNRKGKKNAKSSSSK